MASIGAKVAAEKAHKQHVFDGERAQAFSDAVFAIVATFAVRLIAAQYSIGTLNHACCVCVCVCVCICR